MDPRCVFGEFFQEHGGEDGAAPTAAGIDHVGDVRLEVFLVFVVEGKAPHLLAGLLVGVGEAVVHLIVAGEDSGVHVAESHDYGAGQGGGVHEMSAAGVAGVTEAVGEDEASFGGGLGDLGGLGGHGDLHVARLLRLAGRHIFSGADDGGDFDFGLQEGDGPHGANHGSAAGHVVLHFLHAVGGPD